MTRTGALLLCLAVLPPPAAFADPVAQAGPPPLAEVAVNSIPAAQDIPYPGGPIRLDIDASDTVRAIYRVTETIPLAPGTADLVLMLPRWLPGTHAPRGTADQLVDLRFFVDGRPIAWHRDPVDVFAFHLDLPPGARTVVARFVHTSPLQTSEGRISMTADMLDLQWDRMSLYPAGYYVRRIRVTPQVTFPAGWGVATALDGRVDRGATIAWAETDYATLVDSPIFAGINFKRFALGHDVSLDVVADKPAGLAIAPANLKRYAALVDEALLTFGGRHFDHYDFLLALTDRMGGIGLEHHRSSENAMSPDAFTAWADHDFDRNLLAHEFAHSWNGKFRRPAGLWTPDYREPMRGDLLWVYEGQTQFWGYVLAARSGVQSRDMMLGLLANVSGLYTQSPGRDWRSVEDTTRDPVIAMRNPLPYLSLARSEDYYGEGALVWLEADQIIRAGTQGRRGLDDFAAAFFGGHDDGHSELPYEEHDIIAALNAVHPHDWAGFFHSRIDSPGQPPPLAGIEMGGYRLVFRDQPNPFDRARMDNGKYLSLYHSLGIVIDTSGRVTGCRWDSPAFDAGIVSGARIIAVNGIAYEQEGIKSAIAGARAGRPGAGPIELVVQRGDRVQVVRIDYRDGLRWPWLERAAPGGGPAPLDLLLAPRRPGAG